MWTRDVGRAHRVAHALRAGMVWINAYRAVAYTTPFGGYKMSGLGRENGLDSLHEYTEVKSVWVEISGQTRDPFRLAYASPALYVECRTGRRHRCRKLSLCQLRLRSS